MFWKYRLVKKVELEMYDELIDDLRMARDKAEKTNVQFMGRIDELETLLQQEHDARMTAQEQLEAKGRTIGQQKTQIEELLQREMALSLKNEERRRVIDVMEKRFRDAARMHECVCDGHCHDDGVEVSHEETVQAEA